MANKTTTRRLVVQATYTAKMLAVFLTLFMAAQSYTIRHFKIASSRGTRASLLFSRDERQDLMASASRRHVAVLPRGDNVSTDNQYRPKRRASATVLRASMGLGGVESVATAITSITAAAPLLGSLGALTVVIALHEAGHLVAALSQGIRVEGFSIGFGPKLLSYRNKGEGDLASRISGPSWGFGGTSKRRKRTKGADAGDDEIDGVEYAIRAVPVGGFVSFPNNYEMDESGAITEFEDPNLLANRTPASRALVVVAGVVVNLMLAWACTFGSVMTSGVIRPHFGPGVIVSEITDEAGSAAKAGFQSKDLVVSLNGNKIEGDRLSLDKAVGLIRGSEGTPVAVEFIREGGKPTTRVVQPKMNSAGKYSIGVRLAPNMDFIERKRASDPIMAAGMAVEETVGLVRQTVDSLVHFVSSGSTDGMSGPVEIVKVGAEVATEDGATALLQFAAVLSVNLAVINSLPIPGLDGGQMVFILAELVARRKLDRGVTETINGVALLILLSISLSTFAGDLGISDVLQRIVGGAVR